MTPCAVWRRPRRASESGAVASSVKPEEDDIVGIQPDVNSGAKIGRMFLPPEAVVTPHLPLAMVWAAQGFFGHIILGLIIGAIAKALMPGKDPGGCIITMIIGVVGAGIGSVLGSVIFNDSNYSAGWIMSIVGAMLLLFLYRLIVGKNAS